MLTRANRAGVQTLVDGLTRDWTSGDGRAVVYLRPDSEPEAVSRGELRETAARWAGALTALGLGPGDVVIVAHTEGLDPVFAFLGALWMGAVPSMLPALTEKLDPSAYMAAMTLLARHSGARMVVTTDAFADRLSEVASCPTHGFGSVRSIVSSLAPCLDGSPDRVAFLQHSSGTTGLQKGVALSHRAVLNQVASYSDALRLVPEDVIVSWLPLYHDMGLITGLLLPLLQGLPLVLMSPFDWVKRPSLMPRAIHDYGGTLCWLPNFAYAHCARRTLDSETRGLSLASVRAFINCSEPVLASSHRAFLERFAVIGARPEQLGVSYAMAENVFAVTQTPIGVPPRVDLVDRVILATDGRAEPADPSSATATPCISCGSPIPHVQVRIGQGLPDRHVGEIQLRSDCMLTGYHGRPELDAGLVDGWFPTGDLGYLAEGDLYVVGRKKDLIINAGKNLHPHDLEEIVNSVPGVHAGRTAVFGVPDPGEGTELVAVIAEVDTEERAERSAIGAAIRQALVSQIGVAASYVHLVGPRWLLKTSSGKVARSTNRDKWLEERRKQG